MNSSFDPTGKTSPVASQFPTPVPPIDAHEVLEAVLGQLSLDAVRPRWQPDVNILSTQPINRNRETLHV
ncbi:MAG: hypothetical protein WCG80_07625 [Spirochaetales bacterium]